MAKLSLAARFGCSICYNSPNRQQYHDIVKGIAARCADLGLTEEQIVQIVRLMAADLRERMIEQLSAEMREAARTLEFEKAAWIRDEIARIKAGK